MDRQQDAALLHAAFVALRLVFRHAETHKPADYAAGRTAGELARPGEIALVALVRGGRALVPTAGAVLEPGDVLYLSVAATAQGRLDELFRGEQA